MKHRYLKNVSTLRLLPEKCTGCGKCIEVCPHNVLKAGNGSVEIIDKNACMECGACANNCPVAAINVDSGVGCALAIILGWLTGKEPGCDCSDSDCC